MAAMLRNVFSRSGRFNSNKHYLLTYIRRNYSNRNILNLQKQGLFQSIFPEGRDPEILKHITSQPRTFYAGFDPTAESLHVGNLLVIVALIQCQRAGHNVIALVGGATGYIGDPSGQTKERKPLQAVEIDHNVNKISSNLKTIFDNHEKYLWKESDALAPLKIVNNADWYLNKNIIEFLSKIGRNFRLSNMLNKHSVKTRLQSPDGMSFTEFTYQIFQSYDWLHLLKNFDCTIQLGGHDQLGNISAGYEFISKYSKKNIFGITVPLITTSDGNKLGKSAGNAVWLDPEKSSPYELYQYFFNISDKDAANYIDLFTFLPKSELDHIKQKHIQNPGSRIAQKKLADHVTLLVHGAPSLEIAKLATSVLFEGSSEALVALTQEQISTLFGSAPTFEVVQHPGMTVMDLAEKIKYFPRTVDAIRVINEGGFSINLRKVTNTDQVLVLGEHILPNGTSVVRVGKKKYFIIRWIS